MRKLIANARTKEISAFLIAGISLFLLSYALGLDFVVPLLLIVLAIYLKRLYPHLSLATYKILNLTFLFVIIFVLSYFMRQKGLAIIYLPFASITMLATLLFNNLIAPLLLAVAAASSVASVFGGTFEQGILFLTGGMISIMMVFGARRRLTVIRAGLITGIVQALSLLLMSRFNIKNLSAYSILILNGLSCAVIVLGGLSIFEYLFKTITNISLLELADFNQPLLHRLMLEAPGTYHHSLIVGNLSEAACEMVGANSLLARIGAYYHDIGKLEKPEYFSENQVMQDSKHDTLSPTMSKLVIMNHVKEGLELAKRYRLNSAITNFIQQHHGNSLVHYFYFRALENLENDQQIMEEGFRYAGPKPNTKETAIVLLADSVEAATRALKEPTPVKIEELVHKIINNKFIDGQLDECELSLKDLETISSVFIRILNSIYHVRITYPEGRSENNHKQSAKENSHLSEKDKKSNS